MKLKNVKVGVRVKLKRDCGVLKKGTKGTILQRNTFPFVSWDNYTEGHNGAEFSYIRESLKLPEKSVRSIDISILKRIKA